MQATCSSEYLGFISATHDSHPEIFSEDVDPMSNEALQLLDDLRCVFIAHKRLLRLQSSEDVVSEASMVANVYVLHSLFTALGSRLLQIRSDSQLCGVDKRV